MMLWIKTRHWLFTTLDLNYFHETWKCSLQKSDERDVHQQLHSIADKDGEDWVHNLHVGATTCTLQCPLKMKPAIKTILQMQEARDKIDRLPPMYDAEDVARLTALCHEQF